MKPIMTMLLLAITLSSFAQDSTRAEKRDPLYKVGRLALDKIYQPKIDKIKDSCVIEYIALVNAKSQDLEIWNKKQDSVSFAPIAKVWWESVGVVRQRILDRIGIVNNMESSRDAVIIKYNQKWNVREYIDPDAFADTKYLSRIVENLSSINLVYKKTAK